MVGKGGKGESLGKLGKVEISGKVGNVNLLGNVGNVGNVEICRLTRCIFVGPHL